MNGPEFIRSKAPHVVEVADGSRNAKSKSATIGTDVLKVDTDSTVFVDAAVTTERRTLFLDDQIPDAKSRGEGSDDASSTSATTNADVQRVETASSQFINTEPSVALKTLLFDAQTTAAAGARQSLDQAEVNAILSSSTGAPAVIAALAALDKPDNKPSPLGAPMKSHFSDQIGELKAKNDRVRAELKRRESAAFTKT